MIPRGIKRTTTTGRPRGKRGISINSKHGTCATLGLLPHFVTWIIRLKKKQPAETHTYFLNHNFLNHGDTFQGKWSIAALATLCDSSPSFPLILSLTSLTHKSPGKICFYSEKSRSSVGLDSYSSLPFDCSLVWVLTLASLEERCYYCNLNTSLHLF